MAQRFVPSGDLSAVAIAKTPATAMRSAVSPMFCRYLPATALLSPALVMALAACQPSPPISNATDQQVAGAFVAKVVLPQYRELAQRSAALQQALDRLASQPTPAHLDQARGAWRAARQSWETGESWAFGPAETLGFDAHLDDWPVNEKDLRTALQSSAFSPQQFRQLTTTARGFHGIEAVLFGLDGQPPTASQLSAAQLSYLRAAGADLSQQARGLLQAWEGPRGYGASFAGTGSREADSANEAVAEILQGMVGTLEEIAAEKLGKPLASRESSDLESTYSASTQADVVANLSGIDEGLQRSGLLQLLRSRDAELATELASSLRQAIEATRAMPPRLNGALEQPQERSRIEAAISASQRTADLVKRASQVLG